MAAESRGAGQHHLGVNSTSQHAYLPWVFVPGGLPARLLHSTRMQPGRPRQPLQPRQCRTAHLPRVLLQLALKPLEEREGIGGSAGKAACCEWSV